jgi:predicted metalloprotease with PDZ domain
MPNAIRSFVLILAFGLRCVANAQTGPIQLTVDATDAPRRLIHVREIIPAIPGPVTVLYPKWIPGEHGPTGPINDVVDLKFRAARNGALQDVLPWKRDTADLFAFHLSVPPGSNAVEVEFDFISPPNEGGFTSGSSMTTELAVISWNQVLLYPQGPSADEIQVQAQLRLPRGWQYGTALRLSKAAGQDLEFRSVSLSSLIDSPLSAGAHYKTIELGSADGAKHFIHIAADSDRALTVPPEWIEQNKRLLGEAGALFGARHYREYHFLLTLSDHVASFGLEHHESSDDRLGERTLLDLSTHQLNADLLAHEYVHSWNGKFRRPSGLVTRTYSEPMSGELLWIYEGLTEYLGETLAARAGLITPERYRDWLADIIGRLEHRSGRKWRSLADTAVSAQLLFHSREDYASLRRGIDFYEEGALVWLEVDALIRQMSRGARSLDNFCREFYGGQARGPEIKPYALEDVISLLNSVQPYDWADFFRKRVETINAQAPVAGIENAGWKLTYNDQRSDYWTEEEDENKVTDLSLSLGLIVNSDGYVSDVSIGDAAQRAGIAPGAKITSVNGRQYSIAALRDAVRSAATNDDPMEIVVKNGEYFSTHSVDYRGGEKYPHLRRESSKPDLLSAIVQAHLK